MHMATTQIFPYDTTLPLHGALRIKGFSGPTSLIQGGSYYNVGDALGAIDGAISGIDSRLSALETGAGSTDATTPATAASGGARQPVDDRVAGGDVQAGPSRYDGSTGGAQAPPPGGQSAPVAQAPVPAAIAQETLDSGHA